MRLKYRGRGGAWAALLGITLLLAQTPVLAAPASEGIRTRIEVLRKIESALGADSIRPDWEAWALTRRDLAAREQGVRNICLSVDHAQRDLGALEEAMGSAQCVLVGDYHVCSSPKDKCIGIVRDKIAHGEGPTTLVLECLPASLQGVLSEKWKSHDPGGLAFAVTALRNYWPYPLASYVRLLTFAWEHRVEIIAVGPGGALPTRIAELPDQKRNGILSGSLAHVSRGELETNIRALASSGGRGGLSCMVVFCGTLHVLGLREESAWRRDLKVVTIVPFEPLWEYAVVSGTLEGACYEPLPGVFFQPSDVNTLEVDPVELARTNSGEAQRTLSADEVLRLEKVLRSDAPLESEMVELIQAGSVGGSDEERIAAAVMTCKSEHVVNVLVQLIVLQEWSSAAGKSLMFALLRSASNGTRALAFRRLASLGSLYLDFREEALRVASAPSEPSDVRWAAAFALGWNLSDPEAVLPLLIRTVQDGNLNQLTALALIRAYGWRAYALIGSLRAAYKNRSGPDADLVAWVIDGVIRDYGRK